MRRELYEWLKERWRRDNHPKYQHYFEQWVSNITESQISGFNRQELNRNIYDGKK
jgi:hypothetical protein